MFKWSKLQVSVTIETLKYFLKWQFCVENRWGPPGVGRASSSPCGGLGEQQHREHQDFTEQSRCSCSRLFCVLPGDTEHDPRGRLSSVARAAAAYTQKTRSASGSRGRHTDAMVTAGRKFLRRVSCSTPPGVCVCVSSGPMLFGDRSRERSAHSGRASEAQGHTVTSLKQPAPTLALLLHRGTVSCFYGPTTAFSFLHLEKHTSLKSPYVDFLNLKFGFCYNNILMCYKYNY